MGKVEQGKFKAKFGHLIPKLIADLPKRSLTQLRGIWLNLIPYLAGRNEHETSPLAIKLRDAILAEWASRSTAALSDPDCFMWPSTHIAPGIGGSFSNTDWEAVGMLSFLGYHVGSVQGLTASSRKAILDTAYLAILPPLNSANYMKEWDVPESGPRLRKIAESLAAFTRNAKRRSPHILEVAIAEWEEDLRYLKTSYYDGRYGFGWPALSLT